jgi:hypothetical protein
LEYEIVPNIGKCVHLESGQVVMTSSLLRKFNVDPAHSISYYNLTSAELIGSNFDLVLKIPKSGHFLTAQSFPINPSTTEKALYRFDIDVLDPITTYKTLGFVSAVAVNLANNWVAVSFTDATIINRQFFDLTLTDSVVNTPLLTHVKSHLFREVSMFFSPVSPVYIVAYNNIVETLDTATDNTII